MSAGRLSLCLIVRDEATMLPDLLASGADLWDEICAVDTGSRDATPQLLAAAGARILHRRWRDDFAAARNASLAAATGDWIAFFDADERLSRELVNQVRALLDNGAVGAATVVMRNELPGGHRRTSHLLRLFRNDPTIRFEHCIHEDVTESVAAYLRRTGRKLVHLPGHADHLGYIREVAADRAKKERDLRLLRRCVKNDRRDFYSWYKLLELARYWDDDGLWSELAAEVAPLLAGGTARLSGAPYGGELIGLVCQGCFTRPAEALAWLNEWTPQVVVTPPLLLRRGALHEAMGDAAAARADYAACLAWRDWPTPQHVTVRPRLGLCRLSAAAGDLASASTATAEILLQHPRDPEALHAAVAFAALAGGEPTLTALVDRYRLAHDSTVELDAAVGEHYLSAGDTERARQHLSRAAGDPPRGPAAVNLALARLTGGDLAAAAALCAALADDDPVAAIGLLTCSMVTGDPFDRTLELTEATAESALRRWTTALWLSRRTDLMEAFAERLPAILELFPWLPAHLHHLTSRLRATGVGSDGPEQSVRAINDDAGHLCRAPS